MNRTLFLTIGLIFCATGVRAGSINVVYLTLTQPFVTASPGDLVAFDATVAADAGNIGLAFLNGDYFNVDSPLSIDDSPFNAFPLFLEPGVSVEATLFNVSVPLGTPAGLYAGYFNILGGDDANTFDTLASANFNVQVSSGVPEPSSVVLIGVGVLVLALLRGLFGRKQAGKASSARVADSKPMRTLSCGLLLASSMQAGVVTLYDNTSTAVGNDSSIGTGAAWNSFSTGSNSGTLSGLTLTLLLSYNWDYNGIRYANVELFSSTGGPPAQTLADPSILIAVLGTVRESDLSSAAYTEDAINLTANPVLLANTRYWIGLTAGNDITTYVLWGMAANSSGTGVTGEYWATENVFGTPTSRRNSDNPEPFEMRVDLTSGSSGGGAGVPEPATVHLLLSALILSLGARLGKRIR